MSKTYDLERRQLVGLILHVSYDYNVECEINKPAKEPNLGQTEQPGQAAIKPV